MAFLWLQVATVRAETLLVRPVSLPTPWYDAAGGILSIVTTLLLVGIIVALLSVARALRGVEHRMTGRLQALTDELIPLVRTLNGAATEVAAMTSTVRGDLQRLSATVGVVDTSVREAIGAAETRLATFAAMLDTVQDEAQETVASAAGLMRGIRGGARSMFSQFMESPPARPRAARADASPASDEEAQSLLDEYDAALDDDDEDDDYEFDDAGDGDDVGLAQASDSPRGPRIKPRPRRSA
jgi:hypothetical protein